MPTQIEFLRFTKAQGLFVSYIHGWKEERLKFNGLFF
jgi:hypothetical protein